MGELSGEIRAAGWTDGGNSRNIVVDGGQSAIGTANSSTGISSDRGYERKFNDLRALVILTGLRTLGDLSLRVPGVWK
jgi:hypothetical protein